MIMTHHHRSWHSVEELAKLEQRHELRNGKFVTMFSTQAVNSLTHEEKRQFFNHLKRRKARDGILLCAAAVMLAASFAASPSLTGRAVVASPLAGGQLSYAFLAAFIIAGAAFAIVKHGERSKKRRFRGHVGIAEKFLLR
jgi:hypothetical protein